MTAEGGSAVTPPVGLVDDLDGFKTADTDEAAAVAVAIGAYLRDRDVAAATAVAAEDETDGWAGRRWAFAGRLDRGGDAAVRVRDGTPTDPWTAAGRADRL